MLKTKTVNRTPGVSVGTEKEKIIRNCLKRALFVMAIRGQENVWSYGSLQTDLSKDFPAGFMVTVSNFIMKH